MATASFRFHEALNDFLPRARRGQRFEAVCAEHATIKHMIEALGPPHTELGTILLNKRPGPADLVLEDGDEVEAWPVQAFATPPSPARFVADAHLGGLARFLRMAGFDTLYDNSFADDEIGHLAASEHRIVLTRDRELLKRRMVQTGCYVRALKPEQQLQEVFHRYALAGAVRPFSLCLNCNVPLHAVSKDCVAQRLPPSVAATHAEFQHCAQCGGIFWQGSHWRRMRALITALAPAAFSPN